jgi:hypothetical protein
MGWARRAYFQLVYSVLVVSLALKAGLICISYSDSSLTKIAQRALYFNGAEDLESFYFLDELVLVESTDSNIDQISARVQISEDRNTLTRAFSFKATNLNSQFVPEKGICSHTGIFLCLRL